MTSRTVEIASAFSATDVAVIDPTITHGIVVCGMSQAGKTTARDLLCNTWHDFDPDSEVLPFTNSNGFRGLTSIVIEHSGLPQDSAVDEGVFANLLNHYVHDVELGPLLHDLYENPLPEDRLRSLAVNSVVAVTAETPYVRPLINRAGAQSLANMLDNPARYGRMEAPGLIILDSRNNHEGQLKFKQAGVRNMGAIVLTCPEEVVVQRKPQSLDLLRRRNIKDRNNPAGPMTLPEDFGTTFVVDELLAQNHAVKLLNEAGAEVATNHTAAIVMRTDRLTIAQEAFAMDAVVHGMLASHS